MKHTVFRRLRQRRAANLSDYRAGNHWQRLGRTFFHNFVLMLLIVTIPILLIVGISYFTLENFLEKEIQSYSEKSIRFLESTTDRVIEECISQMSYLVSDQDISVFLQTKSGEAPFYNYQYLQKLVRLQLSTREYLHSLYIYSDQNGLVISPSGIFAVENLYDISWLDSYQSHDRSENLWLQIRESNYTYSTATAAAPVQKTFLSIYMTVNYGQGNTGVVVFNIEWKEFCSMLNAGLSSTDEALGIIDGEGRLLAAIHGGSEQFSSLDLISQLPEEENYLNTGGRVLYRAPFTRSDWSFVLSVPLSVYQSSVAPIRTMMMSVIAGGILVTLLVAFFISLRIYRPFRKIMELFQEPVTYVDHPPTFTRDEEAYILSAIRSTIRENEKIGQELEKRITMLKRAQNLALQAQINPHFLYNTLDAINWMAMRLTGGRNDASVMISKLAAMLRYSLEDPETMVSLRLEISNVRTYLELQELRYRGQFTVEWDIDESLLDCKVIKLLLQPIVENSIYHGLKPLHSLGVIRISVFRKEELLLLEVLDTGTGISQKDLEQLNAALRTPDIANKEGHIGLQNVNQRIRLFFGDAYGIHVDSENGKWTRVTLSLPLNPPEEK